ncbi:MAG: hypothetical protein KKB70_06345 [Proteobacteria bacterium]|nr:hypothetical protein [Pseudomonadota bacterium]
MKWWDKKTPERKHTLRFLLKVMMGTFALIILAFAAQTLAIIVFGMPVEKSNIVSDLVFWPPFILIVIWLFTKDNWKKD